MMYTNRMKVTYNMENIDADFDIFMVEKESSDMDKVNILDSAVYEFKAAAVQYTYGRTAFVLFRKGAVTEIAFRDSIMKEYKDVRIQRIDVLDAEQCRCFYYENRLLAQLLLNSMGTPKHEVFMYNNLTGKLFYHDPSWIIKDKKTKKIIFYRCLEIVLAPGMYLNLLHRTFKRQDFEKWGRIYVIDPKTGAFRKKLKTDKIEDMFVAGSLPNKHFKVDNLNVTDYAKFRKSKLGVMEQFLRDVKEKLDKYITLEISEREDAQVFDIAKWEKVGITENEYGELLRKRGVVIVDENHSEKSEEMIARLVNELGKFYRVDAEVGELSRDAYNIRIIHNSEYYLENEITDPHADTLKGYIVQHMTEEAEHFSDGKGSSPAIRKIVQELIIKGDVRDRLISVYDWKRLDSGKCWAFVMRKKVREKLAHDVAHINYASKMVYSYYDYYRLKIDVNGIMEFDTFRDFNEAVSDEWEKICRAFDVMERKHWGAQNTVEGLLYSDIDNIQAIILTPEQTLPNLSALMDTLKNTDAREKIAKEKLLEGIVDFEKKYPEYNVSAFEWKEKLQGANVSITKDEIKKILNMRTNAASCLNRFLHENYGLWIDGEVRKEEFEAIYRIGNLMNIKFQYDESDYVDGQAFVYYVGTKSKMRSYPNSCCMRKVVATGEKLEYEELLPLMAVEFVRNGQYTVMPFPYKYLREYMEQA